MKRRLTFALLILIAGCGSSTAAVSTVRESAVVTSTTAAGSTSTTAAPTIYTFSEEVTTTSTRPRPTTTTTIPGFILKDGTHTMGDDIQPGFYTTATDGCYWKRLSGFGGDTNDILANDITQGQAIVEVLATDAGFESSGCTVWLKLTALTDLGHVDTFGDGTWAVGAQIDAGRWKAPDADADCYWKRLSNFTGSDDIIANNIGATPTVAIAKTDVGFTSRGCGTWSKIG